MNYAVSSLLVVVLAGGLGTPAVSFAVEDSSDALVVNHLDETLSETERFTRAKEGLLQALTLALEKVDELTVSLEERSFEDGSRESELKAVLLTDLGEYKTFYTEYLERAQPLETLEDVQVLAMEVRDYRDAIYTPGARRVVEFILIFYSEDIINTANERFEKIAADIATLQSLGIIDKGRFTDELGTAESLLAEARQLREEASGVILATPVETVEEESPVAAEPAGAEDATSTSTDTPASGSQEGAASDGGPQPQDLLEGSLNNVKAVYEIFLNVSRQVKETLGLD